MANQYKNKIVYNGQTLIDLTRVTVTPQVLSQGYTAIDASGAPIIGTMTGGIDGDELAYGGSGALVGSALVGVAVVL